MEKGHFYAGLFVMIGLILGGSHIPSAVKTLKSYDRTVNVKGLCEKEVMADKVIWPLTFIVAGDDIQRLYSEMESHTEAVKDFLISGGIDHAEISVSRPSVSDKFAQEYGNIDRAYRYISKVTVTVCTKDVEKVLQLMDKQAELMKSGIMFESNSWENPVEFKFEGLNDIKPEMIEEATKNAREVAEKFAKDSDSKIGKIKTASQGTFTIEDRDSNTPNIKRIRIVTSVTYYLKK